METVLTKVKVPTSVLQDLVNRAAKGSTNQDIIPLSCLMQVKIQDKKLVVRTTDNTNFVKATSVDTIEADNFEIVVQTKVFQSLITKITTEYISLSVEGNSVVVEGNGTYNIPLSVDADGSRIVFPEPQFTPVGGSKVITSEEVRSILSLNKACKADAKEIPAIYNYYFDNNKVLTTNVFKGCTNPVSAFETPVCLPPNLVELIPAIIDGSGATVQQSEDAVLFSSTVGELYGKKCLPADLEAFPADGLTEAFNSTIEQSAKFSTTYLIQALDRMGLFADTLESNKLTISFDSEYITLISDKTKSQEKIKYTTPVATVTTPVTFAIDAKFFKDELQSLTADEITISFSAEIGIQIKCGSAIVMLSVLDENS